MSATIKMRLKRGTPVMQDFSFFRWPGPYTGNEDTWFDAEIKGDTVALRAFGFGVLGGPDGAYGNGAILCKVGHLHAQCDTPSTPGA